MHEKKIKKKIYFIQKIINEKKIYFKSKISFKLWQNYFNRLLKTINLSFLD